MDNPNVGIFHTVMNAVWVSSNKTATQFRSFHVAKPEMRSRADEFDGIQKRPTYPVGGSRILLAMYSRMSRRSLRARGVNRVVIDRPA
jgi:hypothetical protein